MPTHRIGAARPTTRNPRTAGLSDARPYRLRRDRVPAHPQFGCAMRRKVRPERSRSYAPLPVAGKFHVRTPATSG